MVAVGRDHAANRHHEKVMPATSVRRSHRLGDVNVDVYVVTFPSRPETEVPDRQKDQEHRNNPCYQCAGAASLIGDDDVFVSH